jgi:hypothetical protein
MIMIIICNVFITTSNNILTQVGFDTTAIYKLSHEINCIPLLDYKVSLRKHNISNTKFVALEVCAMGK